MRIITMICFLSVLFAACNNIENFRGPIEGLATEWENTTAMVTEFVGTLQATQTNLQDQMAGMTVPDGVTLDEDASEELAEMQEEYQEELGELTGLNGSVNEFVSMWQEKATQVTALSDGLTSGQLGSDTLEKVEDMNEVVEDAKENLEGWREKLEEIKEDAAEIFQRYTEKMADAADGDMD